MIPIPSAETAPHLYFVGGFLVCFLLFLFTLLIADIYLSFKERKK